MKISARKLLCFFLAFTFVFSGIAPIAPTEVRAETEARPEAQTEAEIMQYHLAMLNAFGVHDSFEEFRETHRATPRPDAEYIIEAGDFSVVAGMDMYYFENFDGENFEDMPGTSVWTDETGLIEWDFYVSEAGLYNISVLYYTVAGRSSGIQRAVVINGEKPFIEANPVELPRIWVNQLDYIQRDEQGNDRRPVQVEEHSWNEALIRDNMGSFNEPLSFYFQAGRNTIGFFSQREPMVIRQIRVHQAPEVRPYAEVSAAQAALARPSVSQVEVIRIEGQDAARKSSPLLAPQADNSGPGVYPYSARYIRVNSIGGSAWSEPGAWIEWDFEVPTDGLYNIALNVRQHYHRGANSFRRISINGEVPFSEMEAIAFGFDNGWRVDTLSDNNDNPFMFWLPAGTHTIRMEAVLGGYAEYVREIQESMLHLNSLYRQIVMITGTAPESARDYQIGRRLPHLEQALRDERERLDRVFEGLSEMAVGRGDRDSMIRNLSTVLAILYNDVEEVPNRLSQYRQGVGSLGTWLIIVREQMLSVDAIYILPHDAPEPDNGSRWWRQIWHEILSLIWSFIIDYNTIGAGVGIEVWVGTGRDQANIIRNMIDETFTPHTGIDVTLMLVDMGTLLPATVTGQGPDVALTVGNNVPMDFGVRGAIRDLTTFADFEEVTQRFPPAAMVPYSFGGAVYALPETITFPMLFYRRDILNEIDLEPPETWAEVSIAIETLAINHMDFGILVGDQPLGAFAMFLYQAGGEFYNEDGSLSTLDSGVALNAFREFTRFFTEYDLDREFDFPNRFRQGEMPLAIVDYSFYNMLHVFAPEIRGLWGFRPVPGTVQPDDSINRAVAAGGSGVMMLDEVSDPDAAWEFMKWWTSAETQTRFGREMESLMGSAARHPTANLEAFGQMPWPVQDYRQLLAQFEHVRGIPEVPGGYFTPRQVRNAFFTVVELDSVNMSPRDALTDATRRINDELRAKRREFGIE
ncbi:MAG: extracellular solute-binding protein [Defluviitaleaceae bacterium]|nr:extracellular solute-binding protein [Defluviitaleaceae bacterium]